MRALSLLAFVLASSATAAPVVKRVGNGLAPLAAYVVEGKSYKVDAPDCYTALNKVSAAITDAIVDETIAYSGFMTCLGDDDAGTVERITFLYAMGAAAAEHEAAFAEYLAAHEGRVIYGQALHFARTFGVLINAKLSLHDKEATLIASHSKLFLFDGMAATGDWRAKAWEVFFSDDTKPLLA